MASLDLEEAAEHTFNLYHSGNILTWCKEACRPAELPSY